MLSGLTIRGIMEVRDMVLSGKNWIMTEELFRGAESRNTIHTKTHTQAIHRTTTPRIILRRTVGTTTSVTEAAPQSRIWTHRQ